eukprot:10678553-Karenia_brevis.AAC.1
MEELANERKKYRPDFNIIKQKQKEIQKMAKKDREERNLKDIDEQLDIRDKWLGIKRLKNTYNPQPYSRKNSNNQFVAQHLRAQTAAEYLRDHQWKSTPTPPQTYNNNYYTTPHLMEYYARGPITYELIQWAIAKLKRHKAPGPDGIKTEIFREMDPDVVHKLVPLFNQWWEHPETISSQDTLAR